MLDTYKRRTGSPCYSTDTKRIVAIHITSQVMATAAEFNSPGVFRRVRLNLRVHSPMSKDLDSPHRSALAVLSQGKLQRETKSHTPDLRRCLGHHGIFHKCVKAAQDEARQSIHTRFCENIAEDSRNSSTEHESTASPIRAQITRAIKAMSQRRSSGASASPQNELIQVPPYDPPKRTNLAVLRRLYEAKLIPGQKVLPEAGLRSDTAG
ncbi:hypothetical protein BDV25DRAFT_165823 [Aspergillus avenaceus]|uniref:Uncharacterized protein n=1 Tax=Aspergillus avenaceus TaxID=36643 RepID=A0A5N6TEW3_ASPAV|nr:hypothetical protein BDV25DRAFT_165823 [Aspergillus avenaceus]